MCVTTIQNKERAAERELVDYLEEVGDASRVTSLREGFKGSADGCR